MSLAQQLEGCLANLDPTQPINVVCSGKEFTSPVSSVCAGNLFHPDVPRKFEAMEPQLAAYMTTHTYSASSETNTLNVELNDGRNKLTKVNLLIVLHFFRGVYYGSINDIIGPFATLCDVYEAQQFFVNIIDEYDKDGMYRRDRWVNRAIRLRDAKQKPPQQGPR